MELLPPGPVFLNLLPESGRGVQATQAEVSKHKDSWWQRRIKTGLSQDSFQISSIFRTYFFNNSSLWVVRQQLNNSQISLLYPDLQGYSHAPLLPKDGTHRERPPRPLLAHPSGGCLPCRPAIGCPGSRTTTSQSLRLQLQLPREFRPLYFLHQYFWKIKQSTSAFQTVCAIFLNTS